MKLHSLGGKAVANSDSKNQLGIPLLLNAQNNSLAGSGGSGRYCLELCKGIRASESGVNRGRLMAKLIGFSCNGLAVEDFQILGVEAETGPSRHLPALK